MARKKPVGWRKEPKRHAQAARGIRTAKSKSKRLPLSFLTADDKKNPVAQAATLLKLGWRDELPGEVAFGTGYGAAVRRTSLHFATRGLPQRQASDAMLHARLSHYNKFNPGIIQDVLGYMRLNLGKVYIGREGSPVIYFEGASPEAVNAFLRNLNKIDRTLLPQEFSGPEDVPMMRRNTGAIGRYSPPAAKLKNPGKAWRLWWD